MTPNDFRKQFQHEQLPSVISFTGDEDFVAEQTITALENSVDKNFRSWDFVRANYDNQSIREILADAATLSFNANRRFVIIDNPLFLTTKGSLEKSEETLLLNYLSHPEPENTLIFNAVGLTLDRRKKIVKNLANHAENIDFQPLSQREIVQVTKKRFNEAHISIADNELSYYVQRLGLNLRLIINNLSKLIMYGQDHLITKGSIDALVTPELTESAFDLVEALNKKQTEKALEIYKNLLDQGQAAIRINALLLSQYRLLLQAKSLSLSDDNLARKLHIHPYRAKLANQSASLEHFSEISNSYLNLADIDLKLKSTNLDPNLLFEIFVSRKI